MITRVLPPEQWAVALKRTELPALLPFINPANAEMVVVENEQRLIASMAVLRVTHFEGAWIDPEWRGNAGVVRSLLRASNAFPRARGEQFVFGGATDEHMRDLLVRIGGVPMQFEPYALPIGGRQECQQP